MSKVKYRVREYTPKTENQGSHSWFAEAVIDNDITNNELAKAPHTASAPALVARAARSPSGVPREPKATARTPTQRQTRSNVEQITFYLVQAATFYLVQVHTFYLV